MAWRKTFLCAPSYIIHYSYTFSVIEGTLELHELYSYVGDKSYNEQLKPVIDDHPSEEDVQFMKHAESVSLNSPDESTKV